jgi:hypothetical protein
MNPATTFKEFVMIAFISPAALPALRIARALFLHHLSARRRLLLPAPASALWSRPRVDGDNEATRHVRIEVILIVWLGLTTLLVVEWVGLWIN